MYKNFFKRVIDIILSLIAMPFVIIIGLPICIAIFLNDKGPIFYKSRRIGKGKTIFNMLKFRSMKVNSPDWRMPDGATFNSSNDPRVTKVGKFLRETSLDEIPQVINVLIGQMSFIGPRPGDVESIDTYQDDELDKFKVKPGITGYAQVLVRNSASVREKRLMDAWYAKNISFLLDIKLFLKTIAIVALRKNIYQQEGKNI